MNDFGQLNINAYKPTHLRGIHHVSLFQHEETRAELVILPPGASIPTHTHEHSHELFDVVEGAGRFEINGVSAPGGAGKCLFVPAGLAHSMHNDGDTPWIVRITYQDRIYPRQIGKLLARAIRKRLGVYSG